MSLKINVKDIISKQKQQVSNLSWAPFLNKAFDEPQFTNFFQKLIDNKAKNIIFQPPVKDWFKDFFELSADDLKVVIISEIGLDSIADNFRTNDKLIEQGVLFYNLIRTFPSQGKSHLEDWRLFNTHFIDYLVTYKRNLIYIFCGFEASQYADLITEEQQGYKIFLPELVEGSYNELDIYNLFNQNINNLLEKHNVEQIHW